MQPPFVHITPSLPDHIRLMDRDGLSAYYNELCDRIEQLDNKIHVFVPGTYNRQRLISQAHALIETYPHPDDRPPLFGLPVGIKDIFRCDGFSTGCGSLLPPVLFDGPEATCVTRLKTAGALVIGKTITTEFAYFEPGPTRNPWNTRHTPGGSSSGSAAGVAAGFFPWALGSQTIGSVIRPADLPRLLGNLLTLRWLSLAVLVLVYAAGSLAVGSSMALPAGALGALAFAMLSEVAHHHWLLFLAVEKSRERMGLDLKATLAGRTVHLALVGIFGAAGLGIVAFFGALAAGSIVRALVSSAYRMGPRCSATIGASAAGLGPG